MDNRHFVRTLKDARKAAKEKDSSDKKEDSSEDYKDLYVSFRVHNIHEINQQGQRFHVLFNVYVAWDESVHNIQPITEEQAKKGKWKKEFFYPEKKKWDVFDPQIRFTNCVERNQDESEKWYRVVTQKDGKTWKEYEYVSVEEVRDLQLTKNRDVKIRVMLAERCQGWFEEDFEMKYFPLDVQHLHIGITSRWDHERVGISFDMAQPPTVSSASLTSQGWNLYSPRLLSYRDDWSKETLPLLTDKLDSATGKKNRGMSFLQSSLSTII